ncbi:putative tricarboxylic transport membrane protein [Cryobacterium flavum]|uniref:Putative tricarboxylic transport membrane protein n=1 Tax=Cryobacterium flavum TaxID=1424659 RepID=A0A4R8VHY2_9MICO|nr:tripartite tricarboxylate transporter substrate-binding protein [Cryobacterium flavum]TFB82308.1 tripartite tricarboxylate transporter substrate binding protein [Cryobacterium flavum]SDN96574.1 putative tricarboxylic transport membrane protein [Cryobacterium flavum]
MKRSARFTLAAATAAIVAITGVSCSSNAGSGGTDGAVEYPSGAIEFATAGDPGGGLDLFARQIQQTLSAESLTDAQIDITNIGGGGGNPTMALGRQRAGTAETLLGNSNRVYLNPIMGTTDLTMGKDFVPIAQLMTEYVVLAVREDSPFTSGSQVMEALREDTRALTLGVGTVPSDDQLHLLRAAEAAGVAAEDLNIVAFSSGGDLLTQLLGGQVDAISTGFSEALPQYEAGEIRILAISAPERLDGPASGIPTWIEQDVDVVVEHWRGVFGPADMPATAVKYWEDTFEKMVATDAWADVLERNQWAPLFRTGDDFGAIIEEEAETGERLLRSVGLIE